MRQNTFFYPIEHYGTLYPDRIAIDAHDGILTYQELNERANALALELGELRGEIVGLYLPASRDYVVGLLAIAKAGGAFMPLDPSFPKARLDKCLEIAQCRKVITHSTNANALSNEVLKIFVKDQTSDQVPEIALTPHSPAYVMFTSGSTGEPKAVLGNHRGLAHFMRWERAELGTDDTTFHSSWLSPLTFDVSLRDILLPLTSGGTLCIPDEAHRTIPHLLVKWLKDKRISHMHCVPTVLRMLTQQLDSALPDLQFVLSAGEPLYVRDVTALREKACADGHTLEIINLYGPTETTLAKFFYRIPWTLTLPDNPGKMIPIGRALPNTAALILDGERLCDVGEVGEIYIRTPYRSSGYLNRPELTAQSFIVNPFTKDEKDLIYRTGDMGRYIDDTGVVECLGRKDNQVKINGVRIELGEVETTLRSIEGISDAAVTALAQPNGQKFLVGYVVVAPENIAQLGGLENMPSVIRDKMSDKLPHTSVPSMILSLKSLPRTSSGKINRRMLPQPDELFYETVPYEAPSDEIESKICELWQQLFEREKISVSVPFAQFGGDSLRAIKALSMLYKTFGTNISLKEFFEASTIKALASYIRAQQLPSSKDKEDKGDDSENADPFQCELDNALRLDVSDVEMAMWTVAQMGYAPSAYNLAEAYRIQGAVDYDRLAAAFEKLGQRHESLRAIFREEEGQLKELILPHFHAKLERLAPMTPLQAQQRVIENENFVFDLQKGPLIRLVIAPMTNGEHLLLMNVHHIICDITSLGILAKELGTLYQGLEDDQNFELPALYQTYSDSKNQRLAQQRLPFYQNLIQSWGQELGSIEPTTFPLDKSRPNESYHRGKTLRRIILPDTLDLLEEVATQCKSSLFSVLGAVLALFLSKHAHTCTPTFGSPFQGRKDEDFAQVGCFMRVLPLKAQIDPKMPLSRFIASFATHVTQTLQRQEVSLSHLLEALTVPTSASQIRILMALATEEASELPNIGEVVLPWRESPNWQTARYDVVFHFTHTLEGLALDLNYDTDLFDEPRMIRLADEFIRTLSHLSYLLDDPVEDFDVLTPQEKKQLHCFERGQTVEREPMAILDQLHHWAKTRPTADALITPNPDNPEQPIHWTWADLSQRVDLAIGYLSHQGIRKGDIVAILSAKTPDSYVATLALWALGAVSMPLDPLLPDGRIHALLQQCHPRCVLLNRENTHRVGQFPTMDLTALYHSMPCSMTVPALTDPIVLLFTSGSTGTPKASLHRLSALLNTTLGYNDTIKLDSQDRLLHFASVSFDAAQLDTLTALYAGATSVLIDRTSTENWDHFQQWLNKTGVTVATLPAAYIKALLRDAPNALNSLRVLVSAGEVPTAELLSPLVDAGIRVFNGFGPSEAGICTALYPMKTQEDDVPIGRPLPNTIVFLTDESGQRVPLGCDGEICIAGASVSMGYLDEQRSKGTFIEDKQYGRTYRSGDIGRWREDGLLLYRGRTDDQVKIAGNRIEPNEIAQTLCTSPWIANAVAKAFYDSDKRPFIVLWYQPREQSCPPNETDLRQWLAQRVPSYGMPRFLCMIERIPLTTNGKVDYKQLHLPQESSTTSSVPVSEEKTSSILEIWRTLLKRPQLQATDNVFVHGADSITAIRVISRLKELGLVLSVQDIFNYQSPQDQLQHVREMKAPESTISGNEELFAPLPLAALALQEIGVTLDAFTQTVALKSSLPIPASVLKNALARLVTHHPSLKTTFGVGDKDQKILNQDNKFVFEDMGPEDQLEACATRLRDQLNAHQGVLLGAALAKNGTLIVLTIHHLAVDGVSWRTIVEDLSTLLDSEAPLPKENFSFAQRMKQLAHANDFYSELAYWKEVVSTGESLPVNPTRIRYAKHFTHQTHTCSKDLTQNILDCARWLGEASLQPILLVALSQTLYHHFNLRRPLVWMEGHGRNTLEQEDLSRTIGWFTSLYPLSLPWANDRLERLADTKNTLHQPRCGGLGWSVLRYLFNEKLTLPRSACLFNYLGRFDTENTNEAQALQVCSLGSLHDTPDNQVKHSAIEFTILIDANGELEITISTDQQEPSLPKTDELLRTYIDSLSDICNALNQYGHPLLSGSDLGDPTLRQAEFVKLTQQYGASRIEAIRPLIDAEYDRLADSVLVPNVSPETYLKYSHTELSGPLDAKKWLERLKKFYLKSKTLRSAVVTQGVSHPKVVVLKPEASWDHLFIYRDLSSDPHYRQKIDQFREDCFSQINDLSEGNLFRVGFFQTEVNRVEIVFVFHHFILDRWSVDQLFEAIAFDRTESVIDLDTFAKWERTRDDRADLQWWDRYLKSLASYSARLPNIGGISPNSRNEKLSVPVPENLLKKAQHLATQHHISLASLLQVAVGAALSVELKSPHPIWACKHSGRTSDVAQMENMLGCFSKDLPMSLNLQSHATVLQSAIDLDRHFKNMQQHAFIHRQTLAWPTMDFSFIMENSPKIEADTAWQTRSVTASNPSTLPIVLIIEVRPTFTLFFNFAPDRISRYRVNELAQRIMRAFEFLIEAPHQPLQKLLEILNNKESLSHE